MPKFIDNVVNNRNVNQRIIHQTFQIWAVPYNIAAAILLLLWGWQTGIY